MIHFVTVHWSSQYQPHPQRTGIQVLTLQTFGVDRSAFGKEIDFALTFAIKNGRGHVPWDALQDLKKKNNNNKKGLMETNTIRLLTR